MRQNPLFIGEGMAWLELNWVTDFIPNPKGKRELNDKIQRERGKDMRQA